MSASSRSSRRAPGVLLALLLLLSALPALPHIASAAAGKRARRITAAGASFSESWAAMRRRTATRSRAAAVDPAANRPRPRRVPFPRPGRPRPGIAGFGFTPPGEEPAQEPGTQFKGLDLEAIRSLVGFRVRPPDTQVAAGPRHLVEAINIGISVYSKNGFSLGLVGLTDFFSVSHQGRQHPLGGTTDPRVLFDPHTGRFFLCAIEFGEEGTLSNNHLFLAVSRTDDPTGIWDKYLLPIGAPPADGFHFLNDFPTLGVDSNGLYFGVDQYAITEAGEFVGLAGQIVATPLAPLVAARPFLGPLFAAYQEDTGINQPAQNFDPVPPQGRAWFLGQDLTAEGYNTGHFYYRTLQWTPDGPGISDRQELPTEPYAAALPAPARGIEQPLDVIDDRPHGAMIRGGRLWTCRPVGVNAGGTVNFAQDGTSDADRTGVEWFELDTAGESLEVVQNGRVWDPSPENPRFYFIPSIAVTGQGHAVLGFSGSSVNEYPAAYTCGRLAGDAPGAMGRVTLLRPGQDRYDIPTEGAPYQRWGDYSATCVDPADDMTVWTAQEYSEFKLEGRDNWGTWIAQLRAPPPRLDSPAAVVYPGQTGVSLVLDGSGFFAGPHGLDVQFTGGGVRTTAIRSVTPTQVRLTLDVDPNAAPGSRDIVLHNADGQYAIAEAGLAVAPPPEGRLEVQGSLDFGTVRGLGPRFRTVRVRNRSAVHPLLVGVTGAAGGSGAFTALEAGERLLLPAGAAATLSVRFDPRRPGRARGVLSLTSSDPARPTAEVRLRAVVLAGRPGPV